LPDTAIDLMDEAASGLRLQQESRPEPLEKLEREILTIRIELEALKGEDDVASRKREAALRERLARTEGDRGDLNAIWESERADVAALKAAQQQLEEARRDLARAQREGNFNRAGELIHSEIPRLEEFVQKTQKEGEDHGAPMLADCVQSEHVAQVIARATGIPAGQLMSSERSRLLTLEDTLRERVVGQETALTAVADCVRMARTGLQAQNRPLGVFFFLGPTGVGKTELSKALASSLFDDDKAMLRIDCSEYMERFSVSRLIGAPPGYVGYEEGGVLTEAVRRRPYQIVLFDEFEKAHREVSNLLLQVFDEGHLQDSHGRRVDFKNTICILTSNILSPSPNQRPEQALRQHFPPEFINRLDEVVRFDPLTREHMGVIADIQLRFAEEALHRETQAKLTVSPNARAWISEEGYDEAYGARELRRVVQTHVLHPLSRLLLSEGVSRGDIVEVDINSSGTGLALEVVPGLGPLDEE
jgi:ATP-dependent Clp protease ATP-binding subunit ClpB